MFIRILSTYQLMFAEAPCFLPHIIHLSLVPLFIYPALIFFFFLVLGSKVLANNETKSLLSEIL